MNRVLDIALSDGTPIWDQFLGAVYAGSFDLVTIDFLANGGDGYDFSGLALSAFQRENGLPPTGLPDQPTLVRLL